MKYDIKLLISVPSVQAVSCRFTSLHVGIGTWMMVVASVVRRPVPTVISIIVSTVHHYLLYKRDVLAKKLMFTRQTCFGKSLWFNPS